MKDNLGAIVEIAEKKKLTNRVIRYIVNEKDASVVSCDEILGLVNPHMWSIIVIPETKEFSILARTINQQLINAGFTSRFEDAI
jgi:hypothetical protein